MGRGHGGYQGVGMYLVDTNVLSELSKPEPDPHVKAFFMARESEEAPIFVSVLTFGEMRRGVLALRHRGRKGDLERSATLEDQLEALRTRYQRTTLDVDAAISEIWARLSVPSRHNPIDKLLAATAIERKLKMVTRNVRDFRHQELEVINPFDDQDGLCRGVTCWPLWRAFIHDYRRNPYGNSHPHHLRRRRHLRQALRGCGA